MSIYTEEEIKLWEDLDFQAEQAARQAFIKTGRPLNKRHAEYLREKAENGKRQIYEPRARTPCHSSQEDATSPETVDDETVEKDSKWSPADTTAYQQPRQGQIYLDNSLTSSFQKSDRHIYNLTIMSSVTCRWHGVIAIANPCTEQSWVSRAVVIRTKLRIKKRHTSAELSTCGHQISSNEVVEITWSNEGRRRTNITKLFVTPVEFGATFEIMFGCDVNLERLSCGQIPDTSVKRSQDGKPESKLADMVTQMERVDSRCS